MKYLLLTILFCLHLNCLKARKSIFDFSTQSGQVLIQAYIASLIKPSPPANTLPTSLTYTGALGGAYKVFSGNEVSFIPTYTGTVESWSISPNISTEIPGLIFNTKTGAITGMITNSPLESKKIPFIITAILATYTRNFNIEIELLKSGENVWTVMAGDTTDNTSGGQNSMIFDSVSNSLYVVGRTSVNLHGITIPSSGGYYAGSSGFISKYDLSGERKWTKIFGVNGANVTIPRGVILDSSGNIYIAGSAGAGNINGLVITLGAFPHTAGFIIKYDGNGNQLWINSSAPTIRHSGNGITIDTSGDIYLVTSVYAPSLHQTNNSWTDAGLSLVKYNGLTGAYISSIMLSSATGTYRQVDAQGVTVDASNNIYIAASVRSSTYCGTNTTTFRPALIRLNSSLSYLNCTAITVTGTNSFANTIASDSTGVYITGYANGTSFDSVSLSGANHVGFITKFDLLGNKLWTRLIGAGFSGAFTVGSSIGFNNSHVFVSGYTNASLNETINGAIDMYIAKYDTDGNLIRIRLTGVSNATTNIVCDLTNVGAQSGCSSSVTFDTKNTLYSSGSTNGTVSGIQNPAATFSSLFLIRNVQ